jgi:hypothetical protein
MVCLFALNATDGGFEPRSNQAKDNNILLVFVDTPLSTQH